MVNNRIEELKKYDEQYYNTGTSTVTDEEYDELKESANEDFPSDPYFKEVGVPSKRDKVKLPYVLGSLKKEKINTIEKWIRDHKGPYIYSEKVDGVSIFVKYFNGEVVEAYTRGDGNFGQDITNKAKIFCPELENKSEIIVRGDAVLFDNLQFKNRRNGVAGILNRDDTEQCKHIVPLFYECIKYGNLKLSSEYEEFVLLESIGLETPIWEMAESFDLQRLLEFYKIAKSNTVYDSDGVVISINENEREDVLFPKNKVAFKLQGTGAKTEVVNIEWNVSRGGRIVPTILVQPTEIDGSTVSRTTGFNAQYIEQENIGIGTTLELVKSGDVIPYIIGVDTNGTMVPEIPEYCPSCDSFLEWRGVDLICTNPVCDDMVYKMIEHFIRTLGAENITEKTLRKLEITTIGRLYEIREMEIAKVDGFGDKKAEQFVSEVRRTLNNTHSNLLAAFGIPGVGSVISKNLIRCFGSVDNVLEAEPDELEGCEGVGPIIAENIWKESTLHNLNYSTLKSFGMKLRSNEKGALDGKTITLTGKGPLGRKELQELIESNGGIMKGISKSTDILVTDDIDSTSTKMEKARKYGVNIVSYESFMEEL